MCLIFIYISRTREETSLSVFATIQVIFRKNRYLD